MSKPTSAAHAVTSRAHAAIPTAHPQTPPNAHADIPTGWRRWVFATNHKDIGTMYLVFSCAIWLAGGALAMLIRLELLQPGVQFLDPQFYNSILTLHGLTMIFEAVMPAWTGFANWMVPLQIGAPDMALPRLNNFSFWILPFAFTLLLGTLFLPGGGPAGGWGMPCVGLPSRTSSERAGTWRTEPHSICRARCSSTDSGAQCSSLRMSREMSACIRQSDSDFPPAADD